MEKEWGVTRRNLTQYLKIHASSSTPTWSKFNPVQFFLQNPRKFTSSSNPEEINSWLNLTFAEPYMSALNPSWIKMSRIGLEQPNPSSPCIVWFQELYNTKTKTNKYTDIYCSPIWRWIPETFNLFNLVNQ